MRLVLEACHHWEASLLGTSPVHPEHQIVTAPFTRRAARLRPNVWPAHGRPSAVPQVRVLRLGFEALIDYTDPGA